MRGMSQKHGFTRRTVLTLGSIAAGALFIAWATAPAPLRAQTKPANDTPAANKDLVGTWQGTLHAGKDLRTVVKVTKDEKGAYKADFYSIDQVPRPLPVDSITLDGSAVDMELKMIGGKYEGKLSADGNTIDGQWSQGPTPLPLVLTRATPETEWTIPKPPPPVPPMAADADPALEVATIKPSVPGRKGKGFGFRGREFQTVNTDLYDLIAVAYGLHTKQIMNAPSWADSELFDIQGIPDAPGQPNQKQMGLMLQKLLASRFKLTFHRETRELPVYAITVANGGPKMSETKEPPEAPQAFFFRGLGKLVVRNQTMADFATWMQAAVMDRPVVDQTGLTGRYDFELNWTPDDSQFVQFRSTGMEVPKESAEANAPPNLYTAVQQQLGLKIEATKAPDTVIVIDHVEHPTPN